MSRLPIAILLGIGLALPIATQAAPAEVTAVHSSIEAGQLRVVVELSRPAEHKLFVLGNPDRAVLDIKNAVVRKHFQPKVEGPLESVRYANRGADARLVLDLRAPTGVRSTKVPSVDGGPFSILLDLGPVTAKVATKPTKPADPPTKTVAVRNGPGQNPFTVVIDPGHGGIDPGARGHAGTLEKNVVLAIGRELAKLINAEPGMRAVLTRDRDVFLPLRQRIKIAHQHKADLFVSLHANSFRSQSVRGSSVYAVSERGASSEAARLLAEKENAADLIGGVKLDDKDNLLASVLLDLSQNATIEGSFRAAQHVLTGLGSVNPKHKDRVQQAGFVVLKSPDIPSILVETAFISNPNEERKLREPGQQRQFAQGILTGVRRYAVQDAGYRFAGNRTVSEPLAEAYRVQRGDTLSELARRHGIAVAALRAANPSLSGHLLVGQLLQIPSQRDG